MMSSRRLLTLLLFTVGCGGSSAGTPDTGGGTPDGAPGRDAAVDAHPDARAACTDTPATCAAAWEQTASDTYDALQSDPDSLATFLRAVPKGGDLHNHLSGAIYAETLLGWGATDGDCVNSATDSAVNHSACSATNLAIPSSGSFFDAIVAAWSMKDFTPPTGSTGHDHFFSTFGKFGLIAGVHRNDGLADVAQRAFDENEVYVETMFNLGKNTGTLSASLSTGTLTAADLPALYTKITTNAGFAAAVTNDANVVTAAYAGYRHALGCDDLGTPAACAVEMRFIAQVSRTGASDQVFGQLIGSFEMAKQTGLIVGANLSSPEDDSSSLANYNLQMAMLDLLHTQYAGTSPLHITLHAGELVPAQLPPGNTFHIRAAVETGHAERIGHGLDVGAESDPEALLTEMAAAKVLVEVCLSSNTQILGISGPAHPLAQYLAHGVPVALGTDDQGVSRSSMAGEYLRAALDQHLTYRQLKTLARNSLEHAFLPGPSLWSTDVGTAVTACAATATMGIGDDPNAACAAYLATSERATLQWSLEHNFLVFESAL